MQHHSVTLRLHTSQLQRQRHIQSLSIVLLTCNSFIITKQCRGGVRTSLAGAAALVACAEVLNARWTMSAQLLPSLL